MFNHLFFEKTNNTEAIKITALNKVIMTIDSEDKFSIEKNNELSVIFIS